MAAFAAVAFAGATCASALPAARFEAALVDGLLSTDEDLVAALLPVTLVAMSALYGTGLNSITPGICQQ